MGDRAVFHISTPQLDFSIHRRRVRVDTEQFLRNPFDDGVLPFQVRMPVTSRHRMVCNGA